MTGKITGMLDAYMLHAATGTDLSNLVSATNTSTACATTYGYTMNTTTHCMEDIRKAVETLNNEINGGNMFVKELYIVRPNVAKVETFNNKAVMVTFADGTYEKAVCSDGDVFSLDVGITICLMKKMLGKDGHKVYNKMIRDIHDLMAKQEKAAEDQRKKEEEKKRKIERAKMKAKKRREKAREAYINMQVEAMERFNAKKQA